MIGRAVRAPPYRLTVVSINLNNRTYRFSCGENEVQRLEDIAQYLKAKLEALIDEHGSIGDERLILMAALVVADELFDARADLDDLLGGSSDANPSDGAHLGDDGAAQRLRAKG